MSDPRGPLRTIALVTQSATGGATLLTMRECGHVNEVNQIYHYRVGDSSRCFKCTKDPR